MDNPNIELDKVHRQLTTLESPKKLKILVVDDEPDNLDLLYRTFRRDFPVLKADSGVTALQLLAQEGEVAVIRPRGMRETSVSLDLRGKRHGRF